jgi:hypothetical protein
VSVFSLGGKRTDTSSVLGDAHGGALGAGAAASGADAFALGGARAGVRLLIQHGDPSDAGAALSLTICEPWRHARLRRRRDLRGRRRVRRRRRPERRRRAGRAERPRARRHALHPVGAALGAASLRSRLGELPAIAALGPLGVSTRRHGYGVRYVVRFARTRRRCRCTSRRRAPTTRARRSRRRARASRAWARTPTRTRSPTARWAVTAAAAGAA